MSQITLSKLAHSYLPKPKSDADFALKEMDHVWQDGGAYALLGSSGCGKTTLLNIISGLVRPSHGRVLFGTTDVTDAPTAARNIAQVFQFPVVYDTMTLRDNLAFPLRNRGMASRPRSLRDLPTTAWTTSPTRSTASSGTSTATGTSRSPRCRSRPVTPPSNAPRGAR